MALSLIQAINLCLRGISLETVATDDEDNLDLDASLALETIKQQLSDIQARPWWFNTEPNWKLTPNTLGQISIPSQAISLIATGDSATSRNLTIRNSRIYDTYNHTYNLTDLLDSNGQMTFTFLLKLDWTDLPPIAKLYIAYRARRQYAVDQEVDETRWKFQMTEEEEAKSAFMLEDSKAKKVNMLTDNPIAMAQLQLIGGQNSMYLGLPPSAR